MALPLDRAGDSREIISLHELVTHRPDLIPFLSLPHGWVVIADRDGDFSVCDEEDQELSVVPDSELARHGVPLLCPGTEHVPC